MGEGAAFDGSLAQGDLRSIGGEVSPFLVAPRRRELIGKVDRAICLVIVLLAVYIPLQQSLKEDY